MLLVCRCYISFVTVMVLAACTTNQTHPAVVFFRGNLGASIPILCHDGALRV